MSVIFDTLEVALKTFRHETLDTQDDDVLNFPYKFTRMVNNKRVVVGVKQERIFKLKQCIEESDEGESAVYLVCEDTNMQVAEQPNVQEPSPSRDDEQVSPAKKGKISRQPTLFEMFTPNRPTVASQPCSAARARKIKIFSATEIKESTGCKKYTDNFGTPKQKTFVGAVL